jgi:hypothetical protein
MGKQFLFEVDKTLYEMVNFRSKAKMIIIGWTSAG